MLTELCDDRARLNIGGPSGYAPVAGVCDPERSCSLNRHHPQHYNPTDCTV